MGLKNALTSAATERTGLPSNVQTAIKFAANPIGYSAGQMREAARQIGQRMINPEIAKTNVPIPKSMGIGAKSAEYGDDEEVDTPKTTTYKKGGKVRGSGCEQRGKTRGRMV